ALIVGGSIAITFMAAALEYESPDVQRRPNFALQASEAFAQGGLPALKDWLSANKNPVGDHVLFIVGPDGRDILGRRLSESAARRMALFNRDANAGDSESRPPGRPAPGNFRPARYAPQIVAPDGSVYTVLLVQRRPSIFGALSLPGISLTILGIALGVSALTTWWLAQHLSSPIRRIQEGARTLASERLDAHVGGLRVSAGLEGRKDELAVLARDFDAMADQLRANRDAITQLLRDISHELRSPLARMRVAVGLARQPTADLPRQIDRLEREIERLDALISQVLKLARLHGTDIPFERETFDIDEVIESVVRDANFEGAVKGCKVLFTGTAHITLRSNRDLLTSAVENVLRNAVRYSPQDGLVDVSVERADAAGLSIVIRDRGPGVPGGDLERIFEPFYRVAESRDRATGGEGIGLAITAQVMKTHGGSAKASNLAGGGLEVRLNLPRSALAAS
ncbi:MAG: two-component system, OmpR family, sensor kinase, partial [Gammaproteobacteria bacterium]|nr:two-component system, OmpR family, sensor kinase [Gammaproteobacteria bacterium]